jgi:hypothetical protein
VKLTGPLLALTLLVLASEPSLAQQSSWSADGTHSTRGAYTGTADVASRGSWSGSRVIAFRGLYVFGDGTTLKWKGTGYEFKGTVFVTATYEAPGIVGRLENRGRTLRGSGTYRVDPDGESLVGGWRSSATAEHAFSVEETLTRTGTASELREDPIEVDLTLLRADGSEVPDDEEQTLGRVVPTTLGVPGEDTLIPIRIEAPAETPGGAYFTLTHGLNVAVWRTPTKTNRVTAATKLDVAGTTLYVEGVIPTPASEGAPLTLSLVEDSSSDGLRILGTDVVTVHTTRSAFLIVGHGCTGQAALALQLSSRAYDGRTHPTIVKSRGSEGYWSVYTWKTEALAKIALSTEDALIAYDGHSNYGLGFAFGVGLRSAAQFMNVSQPQIPVNWIYLRDEQGHPSLTFDESEYGDDLSTPDRWDPIQAPWRFGGFNGSYETLQYPTRGGEGRRVRLMRGAKRFEDRHFGDVDNPRIVVKAGAGDMPAKKRWRAVFLNSCYSGQYYAEVFGGRGDLFFTLEEAGSSQSSGLFLLGKIDGRSNPAILFGLNNGEDVHDFRSAR